MTSSRLDRGPDRAARSSPSARSRPPIGKRPGALTPKEDEIVASLDNPGEAVQAVLPG